MAPSLRVEIPVDGTVVLLRSDAGGPPRAHEAATQAAVARMLADLRGDEFGGVWDPARSYPGRVFFVPRETLLTSEAVRVGIASVDDLFGGVVPFAFMRTKAISHGFAYPGAACPDGWCEGFTRAVATCVLPGFTAFSHRDALAAADHLLGIGPVRIKPALAAGSRGQRVARDAGEVQEALAAIASADLGASGVVLETNLSEVVTFSIGQVIVGGLSASYVGQQHETPDGDGQSVYGGSELTVVRGDWTALRQLAIDSVAQEAIARAVQYDEATAELRGFFASRRNYDVATGVDGQGRFHVGVLEASWRVGGASPAELAALQTLRDDPTLDHVGVATVERYGDDIEIPASALVHYHGHDPVAGPVTRYTQVLTTAVG